jgi:hypothetical protein
MAAISTDSPRWSPSTHVGQQRAPVHLQLVSSGSAAPYSPAARVLLVVTALILVVAVAIGTAAFGRLLDSHRGIPAVATTTAGLG